MMKSTKAILRARDILRYLVCFVSLWLSSTKGFLSPSGLNTSFAIRAF